MSENNYKNNAKLVMIWGDHSTLNADAFLQGMSGLISVATDGLERNKLFTTHCQWAYDLKIPFLALVKPRISDYSGLGAAGASSLDNWPKPEEDVNFKLFDRQFCMGSPDKLRAIHGVIVDMRDTDMDNGNTIAGAWYAKAIEYVTSNIWNRYKLPWWVLTDKGVFSVYQNDSIVASLYSKREQNAKGEDILNTSAYGVSVQETATVENVDGIFLPKGKPSVPWADVWAFWWYGVASYPGITMVSGTPQTVVSFLFNGTEEKLYTLLGYESSGSDPVGDPIDDPVDNTEAVNLIKEAQAKLTQALALLQ